MLCHIMKDIVAISAVSWPLGHPFLKSDCFMIVRSFVPHPPKVLKFNGLSNGFLSDAGALKVILQLHPKRHDTQHNDIKKTPAMHPYLTVYTERERDRQRDRRQTDN